jgi:hypothetical protein
LQYKAKQFGVQRTLLNEQGVAGDLTDAQKNPVAVKRAWRDCSQNKEIKSTGKNLSLAGHHPS